MLQLGQKRKRNSLLITAFLTCLFFMGTEAFAAKEMVYKGPRGLKDASLVVRRAGRSTSGRELRKATEKIDPFKPFLQSDKEITSKKEEATAKLKALSRPKTALQLLSLSEITLTGIMKANDGTWAMVRDPRGVGYVVKKGMFVGRHGGKIVNIVMRKTVDESGRIKLVRKIVIKVPYVDFQGNIKYKLVEKQLSFP